MWLEYALRLLVTVKADIIEVVEAHTVSRMWLALANLRISEEPPIVQLRLWSELWIQERGVRRMKPASPLLQNQPEFVQFSNILKRFITNASAFSVASPIENFMQEALFEAGALKVDLQMLTVFDELVQLLPPICQEYAESVRAFHQLESAATRLEHGQNLGILETTSLLVTSHKAHTAIRSEAKFKIFEDAIQKEWSSCLATTLAQHDCSQAQAFLAEHAGIYDAIDAWKFDGDSDWINSENPKLFNCCAAQEDGNVRDGFPYVHEGHQLGGFARRRHHLGEREGDEHA